jgi:hypothetical protein
MIFNYIIKGNFIAVLLKTYILTNILTILIAFIFGINVFILTPFIIGLIKVALSYNLFESILLTAFVKSMMKK